jgi:hypothetical protein
VLPSFEADFTTPEGAILCLQKAYLERDIEAAVQAKDFRSEARVMLELSKFRDFFENEHVEAFAKAFEEAFRKFTSEKWPEFEGLDSFFPCKTVRDDGLVEVTEVCRFPDGGYSKEVVLVSETAGGWRVVMKIEGSTPSSTDGA